MPAWSGLRVATAVGAAWIGVSLSGCVDSGAYKPPQEGGPGQGYYFGTDRRAGESRDRTDPSTSR